jgi:hypothetical protein
MEQSGSKTRVLPIVLDRCGVGPQCIVVANGLSVWVHRNFAELQDESPRTFRELRIPRSGERDELPQNQSPVLHEHERVFRVTKIERAEDSVCSFALEPRDLRHDPTTARTAKRY